MEAWPAAHDRAIVLLLPLPAHPAASPADIQTPEQRTPEVRSTEVQTPEAVRPKGVGSRSPEAPARAEVPGLPKYLRLERKEPPIWPDQITQLSILARVLNRNLGAAGERITTNTVIRVAVALLLSPHLAGTTEKELRSSLEPPD